MRTEVIEETKNMDPDFRGEEYVYHYIEYRFLKPPKEVRITKYKGGIYNGEIKKLIVIHENDRFSRHVEPKIPFKKQLIKIPFNTIDFVDLYRGDLDNVKIEHDDDILKKNGVPKETIDQLYYMKIADYYNKIKEYYDITNKEIFEEKAKRKYHETEDDYFADL